MRRVSPRPSPRLPAGHSGRARQTLGAVVFDLDEDSPAGVAAATRASTVAFAVRTAYTPPGLAQGARVTVHSLADVPRAPCQHTIVRRRTGVAESPAIQ
jgi:hypothetical protein